METLYYIPKCAEERELLLNSFQGRVMPKGVKTVVWPIRYGG